MEALPNANVMAIANLQAATGRLHLSGLSPGGNMSAHRLRNLRRDLTISLVLLAMAVVAVVPGVISALIGLAGITGLMLLRLSFGNVPTRRRTFEGPAESTTCSYGGTPRAAHPA